MRLQYRPIQPPSGIGYTSPLNLPWKEVHMNIRPTGQATASTLRLPGWNIRRTPTILWIIGALLFGLASSGLTGVASAVVPDGPVGFGAGATGGAGGDTYWVTSLADNGPGSLRAGAEQAGAKVIKFRVSGKIVLSRHLMVGRDKTIDGSGQRVTITYRGFIVSKNNVIIRHLTFSDIGDITKMDNNEDAILIFGARHVWVDHNTLTRTGDKTVGIPEGTDITVSWNHFVEQGQAMQIGTVTTAEQSKGTRVTVHHNYFENAKDRSPQASYGKVHAYNNYDENWSYKGMSALRNAELYSENNVFKAGANKKAIIFDTGIPADKDPRPGFVRSVGDRLLNGAVVKQNRPTAVFNPGRYYDATPEPASDAMVNRIRAGAGA